ncbi:hypothetical protein [Noviherbaspirillum saxi]|uniref:hypothetical protein n=1 Tax=Noviherbaspirillum saxi TaxID=2320863 RepID=UPI001F2BCD1C|nr:hypothetical protein [Noviherbaspirillum saxi]
MRRNCVETRKRAQQGRGLAQQPFHFRNARHARRIRPCGRCGRSHIELQLNRDYVFAKRIRQEGLTGRLYAACLPELSSQPYLTDFVSSARESCHLNLSSIECL